MKVLYFAQAAELTGCREEIWDVDQTMSLADFWTRAGGKHPALTALAATSRIACNKEYVAADGWIDPQHEVAVIPPVSGG